MNRLTVEGLLEDTHIRLGIIETAGTSGFKNAIGCAGVQRFTGNADFRHDLNPQSILILSATCLAVMSDLSPSKRDKIFRSIISAGIPCVMISRIHYFLPDYMIRFSEDNAVSVLISMYDEFLLESRLLQILRKKIDQIVTMHGALVNVNGVGLMITGESGTGKTTCAIRLAKSGHYWVADDVIEIEKRKENVLYGRSHERVKNYLAIKNVGIIHARTLFGDASICEETAVNMAVKMEKRDDKRKTERTDLCGSICNIMGVKLPCMHVTAGCDGEETLRRIDGVTKTFSRGGRVL
jgi:HPr kinase/phosphorylase